MRFSKLATRLSIFYIAIYFGMGSISPYLILYYQQKGLSFAQIGIASAVFSITGVFAQPLWGFITDKYLNKRTTLIISSMFCSFIIYSFIFSNGFYSAILSVIILAAFQSSIIPIADAYSFEIIEHHQEIQYGRIRLMGNLGYAVGALILGQIIQHYGLNSSYFIFSAVMIIGSIVISKVRFNHKAEREKISLRDGLELFKDKRFSVFIISAIVAFTAIGGSVSYLAILIQKTGGNTSNLGFVWFLIAISTLPVFYFGKKLTKRYGELNIYQLGILFYALRFFLDSVFTSFNIILVVQLLESVSYTFFLMGTLEYLNKITPAKIKATSMTFYTAACGIGGFIGSIAGGMLLEHVDIFTFYRMLSAVSIICIMIIFLLKKFDKQMNRKKRILSKIK
jgi:MFS transporter, PPP family, 3-phenylpropionic acid transporter